MLSTLPTRLSVRASKVTLYPSCIENKRFLQKLRSLF